MLAYCTAKTKEIIHIEGVSCLVIVSNITGISDVFKNSSKASRDPSVEA